MEQPTIRIMAEPQTDAQKCKFIVDRTLVEGGSFSFSSTEEAKGSKIAEELFSVNGVVHVLISRDSAMVTKNLAEDWRGIGRELGSAIRRAIESGAPLISDAAKSSLPKADDLRVRVTEIINEKVNPSVAAHGGFVELIDVKHNDIFLKMGGGCQGCASASATVKQGIEQILRKEIPTLGSVIDVTDHAAGSNPYM